MIKKSLLAIIAAFIVLALVPGIVCAEAIELSGNSNSVEKSIIISGFYVSEGSDVSLNVSLTGGSTSDKISVWVEAGSKAFNLTNFRKERSGGSLSMVELGGIPLDLLQNGISGVAKLNISGEAKSTSFNDWIKISGTAGKWYEASDLPVSIRIGNYERVTGDIAITVIYKVDSDEKTLDFVVKRAGDTPNTLHLSPEWNFVSIPKVLASGQDTVGVVFAEINFDNHKVYGYDPSLTEKWVTLNDNSQLKPLDGYWIYSVESAKVPLTYATSDNPVLPPAKAISIGWNAIGLSASSDMPASIAMSGLNWNRLLGLKNGNYTTPITQNNDADMILGAGYWLYANAAGDYAGNTA